MHGFRVRGMCAGLSGSGDHAGRSQGGRRPPPLHSLLLLPGGLPGARYSIKAVKPYKNLNCQ